MTPAPPTNTYSCMTGTSRPWLDQAACTRRPDLDWFDLDCSLRACLDVCQTCTVRTQCLEYAVSIEAYDGIWGGLWGYRLIQAIRAGRG